MLDLESEQLINMDATELAKRLHANGGRAKIQLEASNLYHAQSLTELAVSWLMAWYSAEKLAKHCTSIGCDYSEADFGAGLLVFELVSRDGTALAKALQEVSKAHDPNDLESDAFFYDEALGWLNDRHDSSSQFRDIEAKY